jgi:hypothetical protein
MKTVIRNTKKKHVLRLSDRRALVLCKQPSGVYQYVPKWMYKAQEGLPYIGIKEEPKGTLVDEVA